MSIPISQLVAPIRCRSELYESSAIPLEIQPFRSLRSRGHVLSNDLFSIRVLQASPMSRLIWVLNGTKRHNCLQYRDRIDSHVKDVARIPVRSIPALLYYSTLLHVGSQLLK